MIRPHLTDQLAAPHYQGHVYKPCATDVNLYIVFFFRNEIQNKLVFISQMTVFIKL